MACKNAYKIKAVYHDNNEETVKTESENRLLFGVDSKTDARKLLQNNLELFEWVARNKIYPNFFGRYLSGDNRLTKEEIDFLHQKGCKILALCRNDDEKKTEHQGKELGEKICKYARNLNIPFGTAIFLEIEDREEVSTDFMKGFIIALARSGYTPGFKANTDAKFGFDREFSRGMQTDKDSFSKCLLYAVSPTVKEYDSMTTTHLIHPDNWLPFAPSCLTRNQIAVWQYGKNCHSIEDLEGKKTAFNLDLVRNEWVLLEKMF